MALKAEQINKLKALGFDVDKLVAAIKADDEQDVALPDIVPISQKDLDARDAVKIDEGKKLGESEAKKLVVTELGKKLNIELKGERIGDLAAELQAAMNKDNNDKIKLLQDQVNALSADKTNLETKIVETEKTAKQIQFDTELISMFPSGRGEGLSDKDRLLLIKNDIQFDTVDGKVVAKRNGEIVKHPQTHAPLEIKEVVKTIFTEKPVLLGVQGAGGSSGSGGRGGKDNFGGSGGAGVKKYSDAVEKWKALDPDKNTNIVSPEFTSYVADLAKADPQFDWNN
jgi:hypothetical protein